MAELIPLFKRVKTVTQLIKVKDALNYKEVEEVDIENVEDVVVEEVSPEEFVFQAADLAKESKTSREIEGFYLFAAIAPFVGLMLLLLLFLSSH